MPSLWRENVMSLGFFPNWSSFHLKRWFSLFFSIKLEHFTIFIFKYVFVWHGCVFRFSFLGI